MYGHFIVPINDIRYVDVDKHSLKMVIYFVENSTVTSSNLYFVYENFSQIQNEVRSLGNAIQKFHSGETEEDKEHEETEQKQAEPELPSSPVDSLEVS